MKKVLIYFSFVGLLFGKIFYAKIEPFSEYNIKSSVSGKIMFANEDKEGSYIKNATIIKIDDKIDKIELRYSIDKLDKLDNILSLQKSILKSLKSVKSKSKIEKDNQQIIVLNTKNQISDLEYKIALLKDKISKKTIRLKNIYLYKLYVKKDDFVNPGNLLAKVYDISKGKLFIYPSIDDIGILKEKTIYINGKKTDLKINKIYKIEDDKYLNSYKCEVILNNVKNFSKVVKIEFK